MCALGYMARAPSSMVLARIAKPLAPIEKSWPVGTDPRRRVANRPVPRPQTSPRTGFRWTPRRILNDVAASSDPPPGRDWASSPQASRLRLERMCPGVHGGPLGSGERRLSRNEDHGRRDVPVRSYRQGTLRPTLVTSITPHTFAATGQRAMIGSALPGHFGRDHSSHRRTAPRAPVPAGPSPAVVFVLGYFLVLFPLFSPLFSADRPVSPPGSPSPSTYS